MKKILENKKAITLIALVITIVVLVILAGVIITLSIGENGLIARASKATRDYTNSQEKDKQGINDMYGELLVATDGTTTVDMVELQKIIDERVEEKTADLVADNQSLRADLTAAQTAITALQSNKANKVQLIERNWGAHTGNITASTWTSLGTVNLNKYGTGKAIINFSASSLSNSTTFLESKIDKNGTVVAQEAERNANNSTYVQVCSSATISYNTSTVINFQVTSGKSINPNFRYSILLIPD